jgi:hypothetical protein
MWKSEDALLLQSKGVGIATYLAFHKIWQGPLVLLSPIPNACEHISGGSMQLLRRGSTNMACWKIIHDF